MFVMTLDITRKKIMQLTLKLQKQKNIPLWSIVNENVIYAVAVGVKSVWGKKGKIVFFLMQIFHKIYLSDFVLFFTGLFSVISIKIRAGRKKNQHTNEMHFKRVFLGFGGYAENLIYVEKFINANIPCLRINTSTGDGLSELAIPGIFKIIFMLARLSFGLSVKYQTSTKEIVDRRIDFLTVAALNIGSYVFYRLYWRNSKLNHIDSIDVVCPDLPAIAAVDEGILTVFSEHGLIALSVPFPCFSQINVLTQFEKKYFECHFPNSKVVYADKEISSSPKENAIMILSPNTLIKERLIELEPLIEWALQMQFRIVFRPTPSVTEFELNLLKEEYPMAIIDNPAVPFSSSFENLNPKVLAAWSGTGLATALARGTLPLNLHEYIEYYEQNTLNTGPNTIYPLLQSVLFWPRDTLALNAAMCSDAAYARQIEQLTIMQQSCCFT